MHLARGIWILTFAVPLLLVACGGSTAVPTPTPTATPAPSTGSVLSAAIAVAVSIFAPFPESPETGAKRAELDNVQTAFDALLVHATLTSITPNTGTEAAAVHVWTGLPLKADGTPVQADGVTVDLSDYVRMVGAAGNEITYAYCWDSKGRVWQWERGRMCVYVEQAIEAPAPVTNVEQIIEAPTPDPSKIRLAELSYVQMAFDSLLADTAATAVTANTGSEAAAVYEWTGLPIKADGTRFLMGETPLDLANYIMLTGTAADETAYAYCWDSTGLLRQQDRGEMCGDVATLE